MPGLLTRGNAAKLYCLQLIDEAATRAGGEFRIVDLGCGDGRNFVELLRRRSNVRYVGVEPSRGAAQQARLLLPRAEIVNESAYDARLGPADAVVSFSVLEHVVDRVRYFEAVRANLGARGRVYLNYDSGHFGPNASVGERTKAFAAAVLARLGNESRYRAPVSDEEFRDLVTAERLRIVDGKGFNTDLKRVYRDVADENQDAFMERWLAFELGLNAAGLRYDERVFWTRNVILEQGSDPGGA